MTTTRRDEALALDAADALAPLRERFDLPTGVIYLDGNSLGALPRTTAARVQAVIEREWGRDLIGSWNSAGWIDWPQQVGDRIARLIGAGPGQVVACDSTSINLHKVLAAALALRPGRGVVVSERSNFPTDLYIAETLVARQGGQLRLVDDPADIPAALGGDVAALMLTHVHYRSGRVHDMGALCAAAHAAGALAVWDLAHSAGALQVQLEADGADFAVGCGYKYLNGGPGAPAFLWVRPEHLASFRQPLTGWLGHARPFAFDPAYTPAADIRRALAGTPAILALAALDEGVASVLAAEPLGGMAALRAKSLALSARMRADLERLAHDDGAVRASGLRVVTPRADGERGSQLSIAFDRLPAGATFAITQALIGAGVVGDFRAGNPAVPAGHVDRDDLLRLGLTPLYSRFVDVHDAAERLAEVLRDARWRRPEFQHRGAVT